MERQDEKKRTYIAIDLKSFYASVECVDRGLDPLSARLVVADESRTSKTICLAVSPALKAYGIPGRARLFEVQKRAKECHVDYIVAKPRMQLYMDYSTAIFNIYMKYVAPEDMHVYSVDECFMDVTAYLNTYGMSAHELAMTMIRDVLGQTGITATAGIGTNLYLSKIAMDIVAKHMPADKDGVRIAELDEMSYRRILWDHTPITDFWRIGKGYAKKLARHGMYTMGDVARCSVGKEGDYYNEELLYKLFGVNAELLIDHAWGYEPCTIAQIKAYRPTASSISSGQVLMEPYPYEKARIIVREMTDLLALDLVEKRLLCDQVVLTIGYDIENLLDEKRKKNYHGEVVSDYYGRLVPKPSHSSANLTKYTSSSKMIIDKMLELFDTIVDPSLLVRRVTVVANHVITEEAYEEKKKNTYEQLTLFTDYEAIDREKKKKMEEEQKERALQEAMLSIKKRYGKNAILKGTNLEEGAMTIARNEQIGGHHS